MDPTAFKLSIPFEIKSEEQFKMTKSDHKSFKELPILEILNVICERPQRM